MPAAARIDLFAIPEDQRDAVAALLRENSDLKGETVSLKEIVKRLEHLVAELNHVVHGKKSEKLSEERANGTPMVRETLASAARQTCRPPAACEPAPSRSGPRPGA